MNKILLEKFEELCKQTDSNEENFQIFLKKNSNLIPCHFMEHHGLDLNTVYQKVPMGNDYVSDFMFITKNSANWTCVHIEIEDPRKPIFKENGDFTAKYNAARTQVRKWEAWFHKTENRNLFESNIKKVLLSNLRDNPINHRFILVYGRKAEIDSNCRKELWCEEKNSDSNFYVMTWDSLFESAHQQFNLAKFVKQKIHFIQCPKPLDGQLFISGLNPSDFEMPNDVVSTMEEKYSKKRVSFFSDTNHHDSELCQSTIEAIKKINTYKKE